MKIRFQCGLEHLTRGVSRYLDVRGVSRKGRKGPFMALMEPEGGVTVDNAEALRRALVRRKEGALDNVEVAGDMASYEVAAVEDNCDVRALARAVWMHRQFALAYLAEGMLSLIHI